MSQPGMQERKLKGISASPGVCIGKAYLIEDEDVEVVPKCYVNEDSVKEEIKRFRIAVQKSRDDLQEIIENTPEDLRQHAYILETHMVLLKDKMLYGRTLEVIEDEWINAEWALKKVVTQVKKMFKNMSDSYLMERAADIVHVSDRIMRNLAGAESVNLSSIDRRVILVAKDLPPAEASQIQLEWVKGFITDRGGQASHTGIIARTFEIPAIVGMGNASSTINNDDAIIVDGSEGVVIVHPTAETLSFYKNKKDKYELYKELINRDSHLHAVTKDGIRIHVMGNIELPDEVETVIKYGGDGIGLYRTEFQYLNRPTFPREKELFEKYREVVEIMAPKPVTIRTLDVNGDKALSYSPDQQEEMNPALGLRAIRYCLKTPDVFITQLRAILRAAAYGKVRLLLPMISTLGEIRAAKQMLDEAAQSLIEDDIEFSRDLEIGIMIEVPSAVIMADVFAEEVDFFSIGTNDLIQYSLAIDRGNTQVSDLYHTLHPSIIRMVKHVADVAKEKGIKLFMCGEMAGDPLNIPILLALELDELSMNPPSMPPVKSFIRAVNAKDTKPFMDEVLKLKTVEEVVKLVNDTYGPILSELISSSDE